MNNELWSSLFLVLLGLLLFTFGHFVEDFFPLNDVTLFAAFSDLLVLCATGLGLLSKLLGASVLGLLLEDVLHQIALVLESITLGLEIQVVVEMLVDLLGVTILLKQMSEHTHATKPKDLFRHASISSTTSLTKAHMAALSACLQSFASAESRVDFPRLSDDQAIFHQTTDILSGVGIGDLVHFVRIQPDLSFATLQHFCRKTLLQTKTAHF